MNKVGLMGSPFQHAFSSTWWKKPKYFEFDKGKICNITFFVDEAIVPNINTNNDIVKIAWVLESRSILPYIAPQIKEHSKEISQSYKYIFTHYREIEELGDNFIWIPSNGFWMDTPTIYNKSKRISFITSNKTMCPGHHYRLEWVNKLRNKVDLYGKGFKSIDKKEEGLADYMFSVAMENDSYKTYMSEKVFDCFATGTIPIYHGAPDIGDHFNPDGILTLSDDLNLDSLDSDFYNSKLDAIRDNFNRVLKYNVIEDLIWETYLSKL
jgi:hypothetical protein